MYTQVRRVQNVTAQVTALLATPANLINSQAESFMMPYGPFGTTDDRHPAYGDYNATQRGGQLFSPWLYEIMKGRNANILNGIADPRIPYYIYNQKSAIGGSNLLLKTVPNSVTVDLFPSVLVQTEIAAMVLTVNTYSLLGLYPAGGRYDDSAAKAINSIGALNAGTGALPHQFITYADRLYLEAELINAGLAPGDAKSCIQQSIG